MKCAQAETFIHAFVDGELAGIDRESLEHHLNDCGDCARACRLQARFKAAVRGHLPPPAVPPELKQRIEASVLNAPPASRRWPWEAYPRLAPAMAACAALVMVVMAARERRSPLLAQALRTYNAAMPLDVVDSNCAAVARWFRGKLDFNIQPPIQDQGTGDKKVTCQGGRLVNVRDRFGAYIVYQAEGGHRLTYLVFDDDEDGVPFPGRQGLTNVFSNHDVYFDSVRGASLAAYRGRDGLSYIVTSDLDEDSLRGVVESAVLRH